MQVAIGLRHNKKSSRHTQKIYVHAADFTSHDIVTAADLVYDDSLASLILMC